MRFRPLSFALLLSLLVHSGVLMSPGWLDEDAPKDAKRLVATLGLGGTSKGNEGAKQADRSNPAAVQHPSAKPRAGATSASLPSEPVAAESPAAPDPSGESTPVASNDQVLAQSAPLSAQSPAVASASAPDGVAASTPVATQSSLGVEMKPIVGSVTMAGEAAAKKLPRQGRLRYSEAGNPYSGEVSWSSDGEHLQSRLAAGFSNSAERIVVYESSGRLVGPTILSETTRESRFSKVSEAQIDLVAGVVTMRRGNDTRTRQIAGLAVSLSALPQLLALFDESMGAVRLFVVGDFWVKDATVVYKGREKVMLDIGRVEARHFQARTPDNQVYDFWLVPEWRNAPARIRIDLGPGLVIDLKADEVEIDGKIQTTTAVPAN